MKKILLSIVALCCTVAAWAQSTDQISAILQKGEQTTIYYGQDALKNAVNASEDGSVITLSSGIFNDPGAVQKSISVYGIGWETDADGVIPTTINSLTFQTGNDETTLNNIVLEGVYVKTINVKQTDGMIIRKSRFDSFNVNGNNAKNITVTQCYGGGVGCGNVDVYGLTFTNCYLTGRVTNVKVGSLVLFDHCIMTYSNSYNWNDYSHSRATYTNSIITHRGGSTEIITAGATAKYCIFVVDGLNANVLSENNKFSVDINNIFSDGGTGVDYTAERTFTLTDQETYKGNDNNPIGIYDWVKLPAIPYVKNLNATVDGTELKVNYQAGVR
ncbi:MAG: hypothetical protein VZR36_04120 [Prevotella sp.]|nr:hypothetical protein [Prevotella sp.]